MMHAKCLIMSIVAVLYLLLPADCRADALKTDLLDSKQTEMATRYGVIQIRKPARLDIRHEIYLDAQKVQQLDADSLYIVSKYELDDRDALLLADICTGNACPVAQLKFLVVTADGKTRLVENDGFVSEFGKANETAVDAKQVMLDLGYVKGSAKIARFDGRKLDIRYQQPKTTTHLKTSECKRMFNDAYLACKQTEICDTNDASNLMQQLSGAEWRNFDYVSNLPGFAFDSFVQLCNESCRTKRSVTFNEFADAACSSNGATRIKSPTLQTASTDRSRPQRQSGGARPTPQAAREARPASREAQFGSWHVTCKVDEMTDIKLCYAIQIEHGGIVIGHSSRGTWTLTLGGDDTEPAALQYVRVDSGEVFKSLGYFKDAQRIVETMKRGGSLRARWFTWPGHNQVDSVFTLRNFAEAIGHIEEFLRTAK